ncbi:MAG: (2Fe-2S)-binding protein [Deltaproteobacteria bacterium]|nr:(2Fe-2S)-binding protein [Deltaproteobacteria bacterium]
MKLELTVNGKPCHWDIEPGALLLDVLREHGYTSVKRGCGEGVCGACTVLVDGKRQNSCLLLAGQMQGRTITTVEGLGTIDHPHPIQKAFVAAGAVQCGFCTPGMVLATKALLDETPEPTDEEIRRALDGNLCRCTGYVKILDAVHISVDALKTGGQHPDQAGRHKAHQAIEEAMDQATKAGDTP